MKTRIDASRLLVWRAAWMGRTGKQFTAGEGSMSKLFAGETAVWVTEQAIQIMGGYGYVREYPVERGTATRRSTRSSRGPPRSSGSSSPGPSPASGSLSRIRFPCRPSAAPRGITR